MYSSQELMIDIQTIQNDFHTLAYLYDSNNIPSFIIKKQFRSLVNQGSNTSEVVKRSLAKMKPTEREHFIKKQIELWDF
uniref:Uncharacterized protein n=1 Tax=viral metagenome TaxID=1070528 RepID=A0A6C0DQJ5_9ZZZZ